jgi:hypothetical protein
LIVADDEDRAGVGLGLAGDHVLQRRFAGAVRPDDAAKLALVEHQREVVQRLEAVEADADAVDTEQRFSADGERVDALFVDRALARQKTEARASRLAGRNRRALDNRGFGGGRGKHGLDRLRHGPGGRVGERRSVQRRGFADGHFRTLSRAKAPTRPCGKNSVTAMNSAPST